MSRLKHSILVIAAAMSLILMPAAADAAYVQLSCDNVGRVKQGELFYADTGAAGSACEFAGPGVPISRHVFGQVMCNFVLILNTILDSVYCGIQFSIQGPLAALLTLYVAVFGAQILMGTAQMNAKEIIIRLLKIGAVYTFATQAAFGIGIAFQFFLSLINDGAMWVTNSIMPNGVLLSGCSAETTSNIMPIFCNIDYLIYQTVTAPFTANANEKVIGFFLILLGVFPPLFLMAFYWAVETFMLMVRMLLSFLLALSTIAFLISLSPIFLSFMLFQVTYHFFENWLRYMASYALQVIVVFAIISMWVCSLGLFANFFNNLSDLIFPYQQVEETAVLTPTDSWGICNPPIPGNDAFGPTFTCPAQFQPAVDDSNLISPPELFKEPGFLYYVIYHLISLILIAFAFSKLLKNAPEFAQNLVGSAQIPPLGAGFGMQG